MDASSKKADGRPACFKTKIERQTTILLTRLASCPKWILLGQASLQVCKRSTNHSKSLRNKATCFLFFLEWNSMRKKQPDSWILSTFSLICSLKIHTILWQSYRIKSVQWTVWMQTDEPKNDHDHTSQTRQVWAPLSSTFIEVLLLSSPSACELEWEREQLSERLSIHSFNTQWIRSIQSARLRLLGSPGRAEHLALNLAQAILSISFPFCHLQWTTGVCLEETVNLPWLEWLFRWFFKI